jgi:hypothetical protein
MRLEIDFSGIEIALSSIGGTKAEIGPLRNARQILNLIELQIIEKRSVVLGGEELAKHLSTTAGLLSIGETQITLHIYDPFFVDKESLSEKPALKPKFHIMECTTITNMRDMGRGNRYVPGNRNDGLFKVRPYDDLTAKRGDEMEAYLQPCQNCLKELNYDDFAYLTNKGKSKVLSNFDLKNFFEDFESIFRCLPLYTTETFPKGDYSKEWAQISYASRRKANWICSCCKVNCSQNHGLLHVHHKDGNRGNNKPSNLEVLCLACHKACPFHGGMYYSASNKKKLENLRISQKLGRICPNCKI